MLSSLQFVRTAASATVRSVKKRPIIPSRAALIMTPTAVHRVKELVDERSECIALRIGVRQRGCNGMSYTLDYAVAEEKHDEEVNQDGVKIFIDKKAQLSILGTEMDYVDSNLSSEFVFNNPNIKGTCGCGESFSI
uniref:Iron-sulfur cluster assembly 1 homolog, mitochondrial n=1 Tax=Caligus rogercresseyi TaxID=217165 RepID=C1BRS4_CALRO|nr:Iron-sulfur cluster assembly 1 homolog, mitochondrial precursor [Caligus rogercresseyi]